MSVLLTPDDIQALWLTFRLAAVSVIVLIVICIPLAWWLTRLKSSFGALPDALINLPLVLPPTVIGFYLLLLLGSNGPFAYLQQTFGWSLPVFSFSGLVIGSVIYSLPFVVQPLRHSFANARQQYGERAAVLGADTWQCFFRVILPLSKPGIISAAVLGFAHTIGEFGVVMMIGGNIPGETRVASVAVYEYVERLEYGQAHKLAILLTGCSLLLLWPVYRYNRRTLPSGL